MAEASGTGQPPTTHRILGLVVHGVGEEKRGSTLHCVVEEFFPLIRRSIDPLTAGIDVVPVDDARLPQVRLSFRARPGDRASLKYEIVVREVHWADAFAPPSVGAVGGGLWKLLKGFVPRLKGNPGRLRGALWLIASLIGRVLADLLAVGLMIVLSPLAFLLASYALLAGRARLPGLPRWMRPLLALYGKLQPCVVELAVVVLMPPGIVLFVALVVLDRIGPLQAFLPGSLADVRKKLVSIITLQVGDVSAYATQPWEASQIRTRFEDRFQQLVKEDGDGSLGTDAGPAKAMFVIAHSLGCPVSYEALSGTRMKRFIEEEFAAKGRPLFYFTVGSAIPAIRASLPREEEGRLFRTLPQGVRWEDFHATYDPVRMDLICNHWNPPPGLVPGRDFTEPAEDHPVVNQMDVFADHTTYWNNVEQVIKPIFHTVTEHVFE